MIDHLRGSDLLLVLDNCEQVVDAVADFVTRLIAAAPWVQRAVHQPAAARTRRRVGLRPRTALARRLGPVVRSTSVRAPILVRRCPRAWSRPSSRCVDRSTGSRWRSSSPRRGRGRCRSTRSADDWTTASPCLRDPTSRRPDRQRALEAAISWSYDLLFPDDQRGLWALGCFADGAPLAGVEHVLAALEVPSESAADVISRLADRSLVAVEFSVEGGAARYRLLDSIRAFALDRLRDAALDEIALRAQADWLAAVAAAAAAGLRGPEQARHLRTCREERVNIEAALAWTAVHDPALGLRIATGFGWAWVLLGDGRLGSERIAAALAAAASASSAEDRVRPLSFIAWLEVTSNIEQACSAAEEAVVAADSSGDPYLAVFSRSALALVLIQNGGPDRAVSLLDESRQLLDESHPWDLGGTWILTAHAALAPRRHGRSQRRLHERRPPPATTRRRLDPRPPRRPPRLHRPGRTTLRRRRHPPPPSRHRRASASVTPPPKGRTSTRSAASSSKPARSTKRSPRSNASSRSDARRGSCASSPSAVSTSGGSCEPTATATPHCSRCGRPTIGSSRRAAATGPPSHPASTPRWMPRTATTAPSRACAPCSSEPATNTRPTSRSWPSTPSPAAQRTPTTSPQPVDLLDTADDLMPSARHLLGSADRLDADHARALIAAG